MSGFFVVPVEFWSDPTFADAPMSEREAWIWLSSRSSTDGFSATKHCFERQVGWTWKKAKVWLFSMNMRGLITNLRIDKSVATGDAEARHVFGGAPIRPVFYGIPIGSVGSQRVAVPVAVRRKVLARSSCEYCGDTHGPFEVDHIVAVSRGGGNEADNLALACFQCNRAKSDKSLEELGWTRE